VSQLLRKVDVEFIQERVDFCQTDPPVHDAAAVRAEGLKVAYLVCVREIFRHVFSWEFWGATLDAVDFTGLAGAFVLGAFGLKKGSQILTEYQHGPFSVNWGKAVFNPVSHRVFMNPEQSGDFFNGVAPVLFDPPWVWVTFSHCLVFGYLPVLDKMPPRCSLFIALLIRTAS